MKYLVISAWLLVIGSLFFSPYQLQAAGLAVSPDKLDLVGAPGQKIFSQFEVVNISDQAAAYEITGEDLNDQLSFEPQRFSLQPGDNRQIKLTVQWPKKGQLATTINILSQPLATSTFSAVAGIKLPLNLAIRGQSVLPGWVWPLFVLSCLALIGVSCYYWLGWRRRHKWWRHAFGKLDLLHHKKFF